MCKLEFYKYDDVTVCGCACAMHLATTWRPHMMYTDFDVALLNSRDLLHQMLGTYFMNMPDAVITRTPAVLALPPRDPSAPDSIGADWSVLTCLWDACDVMKQHAFVILQRAEHVENRTEA